MDVRMAKGRAAALGAVLVALAAADTAAAEGWGTPVPLPGAETQARDRAMSLTFDAAGHGAAVWTTDSAKVSRTSDGGASWAVPDQVPGVPGAIEVALDGAGNRVYAFLSNTGLRIVRTKPDGAPGAATFANVPSSARTVSLAVNPAGDALVAWTSDNTSGLAGTVFWATGQPAPNAGQTFTGADTASSPLAVLDPGRTAVFAFQRGRRMMQVTTADASAQPFGAETPLTDGASEVGGVRGAQAPDGRAAIAWYEISTIPPNANGQTVRYDLYASTRIAGRAFGGPQHVDGSTTSAPPTRAPTRSRWAGTAAP